MDASPSKKTVDARTAPKWCRSCHIVAQHQLQSSSAIYFWGILPAVIHLYPACISPYLWYPAVSCIELYLAIVQQIHCSPLFPTASSCIRTYLAASSCIGLTLNPAVFWPLQDIRSHQSFLALVNHPVIAPSICIAQTIATLLHDYCAIYDPLPTPFCVS